MSKLTVIYYRKIATGQYRTTQRQKYNNISLIFYGYTRKYKSNSLIFQLHATNKPIPPGFI